MWLAKTLHNSVFVLQKKAEYIKKTTHILKDKFASDIPDSVEGLVSYLASHNQYTIDLYVRCHYLE